MKPSIYGLEKATLEAWLVENDEKNFAPIKYGNGFIKNVSSHLVK